jgi:hypothetical protein
MDPDGLCLCDHAASWRRRDFSTLQKIVNSEEFPSKTEIEEIHHAIEDITDDITALDEHLQKITTKLLTRREFLENYRTKITAAMAPIRKLPPEILSHIFYQCLPENSSPRISREAPFILTQVCTQWRAIALSRSSLWCILNIKLDSRKPESVNSYVSTWISRSGTLPLSIELFALHANPDHPAFQTILLQPHRWGAVSFFVSLPFIQALHHIKGRTPMLYDCHIDVFPNADIDPPLDTFSSAPKLRSITLSTHPNVTHYPWSQLTRLHLLELPTDVCLKVVDMCPNLLDCELQDALWLGDLHTNVTSNLTLLSLQEMEHGFHWDILENLTLPALTAVWINVLEGFEIPCFMAMICRSRSCLTGLYLQRLSLPDDHGLVEFLQELPALVELEIGFVKDHRSYCPRDSLLHALTAGKKTPPLLPRLEIFKLWGPLPFNDSVFVEMIESRFRLDGYPSTFPEISQVRYVALFYHRIWNVEVISRLERYRKNGLQFYARTVPGRLRREFPQWPGMLP